MKHAETVTFGGSGLDRAGEVRGDREAVAALKTDSAARAILFWRGKILVEPARPASLVRLPLDHPALQDASGDAVLLGLEDGEARFVMTWLSPRDAELAATGKALLSWHENHGYCARCGFETVMNEAGWQRNCPACHVSHFPRTDPVVIMLITNGNSVLMGRSPGWPAGMFSLLAGFVEPGETLEAAVRRH